MAKTILITGSTDGIGRETARILNEQGHHVLLHGRSQEKLSKAASSLSANGRVDTYLADLSTLSEVAALANAVLQEHRTFDVLINNAGVFRTPKTVTADNLDVRFAVNTIAPYFLTLRLLPIMSSAGRVINLSSAAQSPVNLDALAGHGDRISDNAAYAQSKLALTMWSRSLALSLKDEGPAIIAVNPGSLLATKMVKEAYGVGGSDVGIGADILARAALDDEFSGASGRYFDNDAGDFAPPHPDALNAKKSQHLVSVIETLIAKAGVS